MPAATELDHRAAAAADRLVKLFPGSLDAKTVRAFVAAHVGLNPYAAEPLNPNAELIASNAKLKAAVADLRQRLADRHASEGYSGASR